MGDKAPDVRALMEHNLRNRDAAGMAEDYLASIGWPFPKGLLRPVVGVRRLLPRPPADVRRN
jgi:hypothetical protein